MDEDISTTISRLVADEHRLEEHGGGDDDRERLAAIEVELDQCWDLLRQRRARRSAGQDVDMAGVRPADVVEHYRQ